MSLSAAQIASDYAEAFAREGEDIQIKRYSGTPGARTSATTNGRAKVAGSTGSKLVNGIAQRERKVILLVDTTISAILPITTSDKIMIRGKECAIEFPPDDDTRRQGASLFALELVAIG